MGWGTDFTINIFLNKKIYVSREEVEDRVEELEADIKGDYNKLMMFASSNIKDIVPKDWNDEPINWLHREIGSILETIEEYQYELFNLQLYLDYLKKNNINIIKKEKI